MDYSNNGNPFIASKERKPDHFFKTRSEGRPRTVSGTNAKKLKFVPVLWSQKTLIKILQSLQVDSKEAVKGGRPWTISCNDPKRNLTRSDYILVLCQPKGTKYEVHVCESYRTAIVQNLFPEEEN